MLSKGVWYKAVSPTVCPGPKPRTPFAFSTVHDTVQKGTSPPPAFEPSTHSFLLDSNREALVERGVSLDIDSFHPEMVLLPNLFVKLRACLCDVLQHVSAQPLVFLDLG